MSKLKGDILIDLEINIFKMIDRFIYAIAPGFQNTQPLIHSLLLLLLTYFTKNYGHAKILKMGSFLHKSCIKT